MSADRFDELMRESRGLPNGPVRVAVLEEAVREADRLGDEQRGYEARWELVEVAEFGGCDDRALVAFGWILGYADRLGDDYGQTSSLLWRYKWIAGDLTSFPDVSREQIRELEDDLEQRLEKYGYGYGLRAIHDIRWGNALALGDRDRAAEHFEKWEATPRDFLSNCRACETNGVVWYRIVRDEYQEALQVAEPILEGRLSCARIPQATIALVLDPLARLGRIDEADDWQKRGYRMISRRSGFIGKVADHLEYLVRREKWDRALRMFERHVGAGLETNVPSTRFHHDLNAWMLFERLAERGDRLRKLRLPREVDVASHDGRHRPSEVGAFFSKRTLELAERFNARNRNERYTRMIENARAFTRGES